MYYTKLQHQQTIIEFHNNWYGEESVIVNGQLVSKKSSIFGTSHYFTLQENGEPAHYILTTKLGSVTGVVIDLSRNGIILHENHPVKASFSTKAQENKFKKEGLKKLNSFDIEAAIELFQKAINYNPKDAEVYFHLACAYSNLEKVNLGFEALAKAVALGLPDQEAILTHEKLAFLRMDPNFEDFYHSGYTDWPK